MEHKICDPWGRVTREERRARKRIFSCIRLAYLSVETPVDGAVALASEEFKCRVVADTPVSEAYELLSGHQKLLLRKMIEEPAVRFFENGKEQFIDADLHLLGRLEAKERVGPIEEARIVRPIGTKVF